MTARRVLVVSDEMEVGGSQRQISHLLSGLDHSEWQSELVYFREHSFLAEGLISHRIPVHYLPKHGRVDPRFVFRLAGLLRRGRYDIVHAFSLTAELWSLVARQMSGCSPRLVASVRGLYQDQGARFWRLKGWALTHSDAVIANAQACADTAALRAGVSGSRFDVVANAVAFPPALAEDQRASMRADIGIPDGRKLAMFVGRLVTEKNVTCLLRALALLPRAERPWLAIVGDGPLRATLVEQVAASGLGDDVRFIGARSDATEIVRCADFLILPSTQEGMSNVLLEAMAANVAVIASAVGGNRELVEDGRTGLLFASDDASALAVCIRRMSHDAVLRTSMATDAYARARQEYSMERMIAATAAVYDRCLRVP